MITEGKINSARTVAAFYMFLLLFATTVVAEETRVDDKSIVLLYEARAEIRAPDHEIAKTLFVDYRNARDEFTRYELMEKIKPVIEKRLTTAGETTRVYLLIGAYLEDYDFGKNSFPTGFGESTFVPFDNQYAVTFVNGDELGFLPVQMESARALAGELRTNRSARFTIYGDIVGAKEQEINYRQYKTLELKAAKMEVILDSGRQVGVKDVYPR